MSDTPTSKSSYEERQFEKLKEKTNLKESSLEMKFQTLNVSDWRQAIRNPPSYRIGNSTVRLQTKFIYLVITAGAAVLLYFYVFGSKSNAVTNLLSSNNELDAEHGHVHISGKDKLDKYRNYNSTYPLTPPITSMKGLTYKFYVITDLDTESKSKAESDTWISFLKRGLLTYNPSERSVVIEWIEEELLTLKSTISCGGRGMELSELVVFNGKLFTVDDRTGIIYQLNMSTDREKATLIPWVILPDGNGKESKGFKSEWATVKDQQLYIGGLGKEWTSAKGELIHLNPQWIKIISPTGEVEHVDWHNKYEKLKAAVEIKTPGYMIHEAVSWSEKLHKWVFLPRRASKERYDENEDERRGTNLLITASDDFSDITWTRVGEVFPTHGFSSFKFVPDTDDNIIIALKSEEDHGTIASYIMAFDLNGKILLSEAKIGDYKFEGIEFG